MKVMKFFMVIVLGFSFVIFYEGVFFVEKVV